MDVERVLVERDDRRSLVDVDVLDAELLAQLEAFVGVGIGELPALGVAVPFGRVELHALDVVGLLQEVDVFQRLLAVARIEGAVDDEAVRIALRHSALRSIVLKPFL